MTTPKHLESGDGLGVSALREASFVGVRWGSATRLIAEIVVLVGSVVLARLIAPAEFGVAAVAVGLAAIAPAFAGASFGVPIVRMRNLHPAHAEAAMALSVGVGTGLMLLTIFVLGPVAVEPMFGARIAFLLALVSPSFALAGIGAVPNALLQRELRFRRLAEIELLSIIVAPVVSIGLAATTSLSAEAIVLGGVASAGVATILTVLSVPRVGLGWQRARAREVAGVGLTAGATAVTYTLAENVQFAIIGARLPAHDVGLFWRAYQLAVGYQAKVGLITLRLAFPLFSRTGSADEMRHVRARILQVQSVVIFPLLAALIVLAPEVVPLVYGREWRDAALPVQLLAVAGMATIAASGGGGLAFAAGKARPLFYFHLGRLVVFIAVVAWSSAYGLTATAIAVSVYSVLLVAVQFAYIESRHVGIPHRETWASIVPATVASCVAVGIGLPTTELIARGTNDLVVVLIGGLVCLGTYALVLRLAFRSTASAVVGLLQALAKPR